MTGIERLRKLARIWTWDCKVLVEQKKLDAIADQIERERACDEDAIENVRLIVGGVVDDMERHVSGVEGMEDSPVARWARELREALKSDTSEGRGAQNPSWHDPADAAGVTSDAPKVTRDPADDVSMSAYDLLPKEERDAIAWVREHGGLSHVKDIYHDFRAVVERLGVEWSESELHGLMDALDRRLMPEGYEWPRYESGEPLRYEDRYVYDGREREVWHVDFDSYGDVTILNKDCSKCSLDKDERVKRPAPKVLDADGVEIRVGDEVWSTGGGMSNIVAEIVDSERVRVKFRDLIYYGKHLTHRAPVLAADGKPLRVGETVWSVKTGREYVVVEPSYGKTVVVRLAKYDDAEGEQYAPDQLTHERPVADTWERLEEDAEKNPCDYFGFDGEETCGKCPASGKNCEQTMARDIVRRAKKLAERDAS